MKNLHDIPKEVVLPAIPRSTGIDWSSIPVIDWNIEWNDYINAMNRTRDRVIEFGNLQRTYTINFTTDHMPPLTANDITFRTVLDV